MEIDQAGHQNIPFEVDFLRLGRGPVRANVANDPILD
jgi:hypothetical protein